MGDTPGVASVYAHPLSMGSSSNAHYAGNAKAYMNVGVAMGTEMLSLLDAESPEANPTPSLTPSPSLSPSPSPAPSPTESREPNPTPSPTPSPASSPIDNFGTRI